MTKRRLGTLAVLAIGAVLLLSSCGGGGSKRLTKEQFAAKANALCAAFNKQVAATGTSKTLAEAIAAFNKLLPLNEKLIANVEKLKPPANEEAKVKRAIALGKEQASRGTALIAAAKKGDMAKVHTLTAEGDANQKESKAIFTELGATECAKG